MNTTLNTAGDVTCQPNRMVAGGGAWGCAVWGGQTAPVAATTHVS